MDLANKRLFLLDLDGTLYLEETLLPGAAEFLAYVRSHGTRAIIDSDGDINMMVPWLQSVGLEGILPLECRIIHDSAFILV